SPDWPGFWVQHMKDFTEGQAIPMVINGCCGNIYPHDQLHHEGCRTDQEAADKLAQTSRRIADAFHSIADLPLRFASRHIELPFRELDPQMLAEAHALLNQHPTPKWKQDEPDAVDWEWLYAVGRLELERMAREKSSFSYEIQAFRIGEFALLALIGEPFVEGQLNIKLRSPSTTLMVAHMSNGYAGYIPTSHGLRGGGYESRTGMGSRYAGEALSLIVEASVALLAEIFEQPPRDPVMSLPV
ncbi:MAG: hypothetical protein O3A51_09110, partial [Verrucomicrobia bacterium]|nr:hypothetical protein [Verrucomicrobiota bacterium]